MSREYPPRPIVGIGAVVLKDGQVLLIKRGKPPRVGSWSLPGGAQKLGETVAEGALREVAEETGLTVRFEGLIDVVDSVTRDDAGKVQFHYTLVDVFCTWVAGEPTAGGDAAAADWVALDRLDDCRLWSETRRIIDLAADMADALGVDPAD